MVLCETHCYMQPLILDLERKSALKIISNKTYIIYYLLQLAPFIVLFYYYCLAYLDLTGYAYLSSVFDGGRSFVKL